MKSKGKKKMPAVYSAMAKGAKMSKKDSGKKGALSKKVMKMARGKKK